MIGIENKIYIYIYIHYKLEIQMLETMKLFGSTEKVDKTKNGESVPSLG